MNDQIPADIAKRMMLTWPEGTHPGYRLYWTISESTDQNCPFDTGPEAMVAAHIFAIAAEKAQGLHQHATEQNHQPRQQAARMVASTAAADAKECLQHALNQDRSVPDEHLPVAYAIRDRADHVLTQCPPLKHGDKMPNTAKAATEQILAYTATVRELADQLDEPSGEHPTTEEMREAWPRTTTRMICLLAKPGLAADPQLRQNGKDRQFHHELVTEVNHIVSRRRGHIKHYTHFRGYRHGWQICRQNESPIDVSETVVTIHECPQCVYDDNAPNHTAVPDPAPLQGDPMLQAIREEGLIDGSDEDPHEHAGAEIILQYFQNGVRQHHTITEPFAQGYNQAEARLLMDQLRQDLEEHETEPVVMRHLWEMFHDMNAAVDAGRHDFHVPDVDAMNYEIAEEEPQGIQLAIIRAIAKENLHVARFLERASLPASRARPEQEAAQVVIDQGQRVGMDPYQLAELARAMRYDPARLGIYPPGVNRKDKLEELIDSAQTYGFDHQYLEEQLNDR